MLCFQLEKVAGSCTRLELCPQGDWGWQTVAGLTRLQSLAFGCFEVSEHLPRLQSLTDLTTLRFAFKGQLRADLACLTQLKARTPSAGAHLSWTLEI